MTEILESEPCDICGLDNPLQFCEDCDGCEACCICEDTSVEEWNA